MVLRLVEKKVWSLVVQSDDCLAECLVVRLTV